EPSDTNLVLSWVRRIRLSQLQEIGGAEHSNSAPDMKAMKRFVLEGSSDGLAELDVETAKKLGRVINTGEPVASGGATSSGGRVELTRGTSGSVGPTSGSVGPTSGSVGPTSGSVGPTSGSVGPTSGSVGPTSGGPTPPPCPGGKLVWGDCFRV